MHFFCLGAEHACLAFEGARCTHCDQFTVRKLRSRLALFVRYWSQASAPRSSNPMSAEVELNVEYIEVDIKSKSDELVERMTCDPKLSLNWSGVKQEVARGQLMSNSCWVISGPIR